MEPLRRRLLRQYRAVAQICQFAQAADGDASFLREARHCPGQSRRGNRRRHHHGQCRQCGDARCREPHDAHLQRLGRPPCRSRHHQLHGRLQRPASGKDVPAQRYRRIRGYPDRYRRGGEIDGHVEIFEHDRGLCDALPVVQRCGSDLPACGIRTALGIGRDGEDAL